MRSCKIFDQRKKGSAIAYALVVMFIASTILVSMLGYIASQIRFSFNRAEKEKAFQVAEAGIQYYRWYLAHKTAGKTAQQIADFWENGSPLGVGVGNEHEADYAGIGKYIITATAPSAGSTVVDVTSVGSTYKEPDIQRTIRVRFRRPSWSEYMFLSNGPLHFNTDSVVFGKIHSNGGVRFDGTAYNTVSSLLASYNDPDHGGSDLEFGVHTHRGTTDPEAPSYPWAAGTVPNRPDVFKGGREFPVPEVSFGGVTTDLANMKSEALAGNGKYFDSDGVGRRIILKNDGNFDVCTVDEVHGASYGIKKYKKTSGSGTCSACDGDCKETFPIPDDGIIFIENNAWVDGSVDSKKISVVAANLSGGGEQADIFIGLGNIRYASFDCDNMIGLVAQRDITIVRDCPDEFIVDAALVAQTGKVSRGDYGFSNKATLTFNGAIASYLQPYFNHGVNGFGIRVYNFNNDLLYCPPPYFPTGTEYAIDLWEEL